MFVKLETLRKFSHEVGFITAAAVLLTAPLSAFAAKPGDYNGDGQSDLAVATVNRGSGITTWQVADLKGSIQTYFLGAAGDAFVPGDYDGDGDVDPAVVHVEGDGRLAWHTLSNGTESKQYFGKNGDRPISGDFDCDGVTDEAIVRKNGAALNWYVRQSSGNQINAYPFGLTGDEVYSADVDGDHCDEIIVSRVVNGGIWWFYRTLDENADNPTQWGLKGDYVLSPMDFDGDGKADFTVVRKINKKIWAFVRLSNGGSKTVAIGANTNIGLSGFFSGGATAELGNYRRGSKGNGSRFVLHRASGKYQPYFGNQNSVLIRPDGTVVQPGEGGSMGGDDVSGGSCPNIVSIDKLQWVLYKSENLHGGRGPTFLVQNPAERTGEKKLEIRDANCKTIGYFGLYATDHPYGARYYQRSGGSGYSAQQLLAKAREAGSSKIYVKGVNKWIQVDNPRNRQGTIRK